MAEPDAYSDGDMPDLVDVFDSDSDPEDDEPISAAERDTARERMLVAYREQLLAALRFHDAVIAYGDGTDAIPTYALRTTVANVPWTRTCFRAGTFQSEARSSRHDGA